MPKRALYEKRPYLLASLAAAILYYWLRNADFPGLHLILLKGAGVGLLAGYALLRHNSRDARMMAAMMGVAALGDMAMELDWLWAGMFFFLFHALAMGLFLQPHNRRDLVTGSQKATAIALLFGVPAITFLLTRDWQIAVYGLAMGGMAGSAWTSRFSRYHVGFGALFFVASDLLIFARMGAALPDSLAERLIWPSYYIGQFLSCTGVIQTLRRDHRA